jgi:hypothetical protein
VSGPRRPAPVLGSLALVLALLGTLGCRERTYSLYRDAEIAATARDDGGFRLPAPDGRGLDLVREDAPQAVTDACTPRPELCNGLDDDCDGLVDDGFDFFTDPRNCGLCGTVCAFPNATPACAAGRCRLAACEAGFVDLDRFPGNGCECALSADGVEVCDGKDNDCDGNVDEGFDLQASLDHCGACGRKCSFPHAAALCARGTCRMGACEPGWVDLDGSSRDGCEYACTRSPDGVEVCDAKDNDCDGDTDESDPRAGQACFPEGLTGCDPASGRCQGPCALGKWVCRTGGLVCQGAIPPGVEACDGKDNDCDGQVDEDFDLQNDPRWCGGCGRMCEVPNAVPSCVEGRCAIRVCRMGFVDLDRRVDNGCEYACTPDGPEVCDGKDNDCDGRTDTGDDDLLYPTTNFCSQTGECGKGPGGSARYPQASYPVCTTPPGASRPDWICNYPATVQLFAPNIIVGLETWCDGLDNDCDGASDEDFKPALGEACTDNGVGECRRAGKWKCAPDKTAPPVCDASGTPEATPTHEVCDAKDNDCDGQVDESWDTPRGLGLPTCEAGADCRGVRDDLVHVTVAGKDYYIYAHEASRPDAKSDAEGTKDGRACSRSPGGGVRPWTRVTYGQAQAACAGAGMRLCRVRRETACSSAGVTEDEWGLACTAGLVCPDGAARAYPYGCSYEAQTCNGRDMGRAQAAPAGSLASCVSGDLDATTAERQSAFDMSGNLAEWTDDCRGTLGDGTGRKIYTLRGGSYSHIAQALRCDFTALVVAETFAFEDTGFRCCSSCAPGLGDCDGRCVPLGSDAQNCGRCGNACPAGQSCANGTCR